MVSDKDIKAKDVEIAGIEKSIVETMDKLKVEQKLRNSAITLSKVHKDSSAKAAAQEQVRLAEQKVIDLKLKLEFQLFDLKDNLDNVFKLHTNRIKAAYEAIHGANTGQQIDFENFDELHDSLQDLKAKVRNLDSLIEEKSNNRDKQKLKKQTSKKSLSQAEIADLDRKIEVFGSALNDLLVEYRQVAPKYVQEFVSYWEKELNSPKSLIAKRAKSSSFSDFNSPDVMDSETRLGSNLSNLYLSNRTSVSAARSNQSLNIVNEQRLEEELSSEGNIKKGSLTDMVPKGLKRGNRISRPSPKQSETNLASASNGNSQAHPSNVEIKVETSAVVVDPNGPKSPEVVVFSAEPEEFTEPSGNHHDYILLKEKCDLLSSNLLNNGVDKMYLDMAEQLAEARTENKKLSMQLKRRFSKSESLPKINGDGSAANGDSTEWKSKYDDMKAKYAGLSEEKASLVAQFQMQSKSQNEEIQEMTNEMLSLVKVHKELETRTAAEYSQVQEKLGKVEASLISAQQKEVEYKAKIRAAEDECLKLLNEKDSLTGMLGSKSREELKAQEDMQNQLAVLERSIELLNEQVINLQKEKQEALHQGESRISVVKAQLERVQLDFHESAIELSTHKDTAETLEQKLNESLDREASLKTRIDALLSEVATNSATSNIDAFQEEIQSLKAGLSRVKLEKEAVEKSNDGLLKEVSSMKKSLLQVPILEDSVNESKRMLKVLDEKHACAVQENGNLSIQLEKERDLVNSLTVKLERATKDLSAIQEKVTESKSVDVQKNRLMEDRVRSLESDLTAAHRTLESEKQKYVALLQSHSDEAASWKQKEVTLRREVQQLRDMQHQQSKAATSSFSQHRSAEDDKLRELLERNASLNDSLSQKEQQLGEYKKRYQIEVDNVAHLKKVLDEITDTTVAWPTAEDASWTWNALFSSFSSSRSAPSQDIQQRVEISMLPMQGQGTQR